MRTIEWKQNVRRSFVALAVVGVGVVGGARVVSAGQDHGSVPRMVVDDPAKQRLIDNGVALLDGSARDASTSSAAAASVDKLPVPIVGDADMPWPLGVFQDDEAPVSLMDFTPVTRWVGVVGNEYVVLHTGSDTQTPENGAIVLMHYDVSDASLRSVSSPAVPPGEGTLTIVSATSTDVLMHSANGAVHTFNIVTGQVT